MGKGKSNKKAQHDDPANSNLHEELHPLVRKSFLYFFGAHGPVWVVSRLKLRPLDANGRSPFVHGTQKENTCPKFKQHQPPTDSNPLHGILSGNVGANNSPMIPRIKTVPGGLSVAIAHKWHMLAPRLRTIMQRQAPTPRYGNVLAALTRARVMANRPAEGSV